MVQSPSNRAEKRQSSRYDASHKAELDYFRTLAFVDGANRAFAQEQERLRKAQEAVEQLSPHSPRLESLGIDKDIVTDSVTIQRGWTEQALNERVSALYSSIYGLEQAEAQYQSMLFQSRKARMSLMRGLLTLVMIGIGVLILAAHFTGFYISFIYGNSLVIGIAFIIAGLFIPKLIFRDPTA